MGSPGTVGRIVELPGDKDINRASYHFKLSIHREIPPGNSHFLRTDTYHHVTLLVIGNRKTGEEFPLIINLYRNFHRKGKLQRFLEKLHNDIPHNQLKVKGRRFQLSHHVIEFIYRFTHVTISPGNFVVVWKIKRDVPREGFEPSQAYAH
jgi:hypothetical protein